MPGLKYTPAVSMKLNVSIDSRAVQEAFARAPDVFLSEMERGAKEGLTEIQRDAVRNHRFKRKSGNLERSVRVDFKSFKEPGTGIRLETGIASYAPYVHEGTRPHKIAPKNKAALSFIGKDGRFVLVPKNMGYAQTRQYWIKQAKLTGSHLGFKGFVNHPGTKPDPFLYEAAIRGTDQLIQKIVAGIGKAISKIGLKGK